MTTRTAETLPPIFARVAGLCAPLVINTSSRYLTLAIVIHEQGD